MKNKTKKYLTGALMIMFFGVYLYNQHMSDSKQATVSSNLLSTAEKVKLLTKPLAGYRNGTYVGSNVDAYYGNVQVQATITNGRLTDVSFLNYPQDRNASLRRSDYAMPILKSEAIAAQTANVNTVSSATSTSEAFISSLASALSKASA
ncbi:MAG: FMN-binding protein [Patescibacteria group bacterium]|nr:FMN-binding protein [Patescibacteria group bacterium]